MLKEKLDKLQAFGAQNAENQRVSQDELDLDQNSFKELDGFEQGLKDPKLMARKEQEEQNLRAAIDSDPARKKKFGELWDEISTAYREYAAFFKPYYLLEAAPDNSDLFAISRNVVRYAEETHQPNEQRLREYQDAGLESLGQEMYSPAPIHNALQEVQLATLFHIQERELGAENPTVKAVLAGRTPEEAAHYYVSTSTIQDVAERKRLAHDFDAVKKSKDGMIQLALILDGPARKYRKEYEDKVGSAITSSAAKIAQARFAVYGANKYPDATFTPRLTYGPVKGYQEAGNAVPWDTTLAGLYKHATGQEPFKLPPTWIEAKSSLDLNTPFDFVTTADTHGGNSGSPTVNTKGELIGILFDGNLEDIPNRYLYTDQQARSVHVAGDAIIEALRKVYHADRVLNEIGF
jgi:hypothetical protein